jgi:hypothetical protein
MMHPIIGTWRLLAYRIQRPDGSSYEPFGPTPLGLLVYTANGQVSAQLCHPDRPRFERGRGTPEETRATFDRYIAYFGTYSLSPDGRAVTHHPIASLQPWRDGVDQLRPLRLRGSRLTLEADLTIAGVPHSAILEWERIP